MHVIPDEGRTLSNFQNLLDNFFEILTLAGQKKCFSHSDHFNCFTSSRGTIFSSCFDSFALMGVKKPNFRKVFDVVFIF